MASSERLNPAGQLYVAAVSCAGLLAVLHSVLVLFGGTIRVGWLVLAFLTLLSGSFTVRIPTVPARLSVSETFVFAAVLMFGPAAATVIVVLDTLVISFWLGRRAVQVSRVFFNMAAPSVAIWVSSNLFYWWTGIAPLTVKEQPVLSLVAPVLALAVLYFLLNSWLVAGAVAFQKQRSAFSIWKHNFLWLSLNYFSGASVALLLLPYLLPTEQSAILKIAGIFLPLLLISYLTFKTALGRVDDANRHLSELNSLYLSTIETLAMAIDAKDQITHGHIRRVQQFAVGLAKYLGVTDSAQISAIEAASLLHDMGKLAVPEYILNKPGRLTAAEFEKMKLHASVGADILSAIPFPYPVVPIVRHHHENWDGTGYPDGLRGAEIPIGARILAVVDCFDALTSDRPYRPRLPDTEAIRILLQRRGKMYDPIVVDAFVRVYSDIAPSAGQATASVTQGLTAIARGTALTDVSSASLRLEDIAASTEEGVALYELAATLSGQLNLDQVIDTASKHLKRLLPLSASILFVYDVDADELLAASAAGDAASHFSGIRIARGQRLSGWVAANRKTIINSDPILDLGEAVRTLKPRLLSCASTPLVLGDQLVGVLTVYSTQRDAFNDDHRRVLESAGKLLSHATKSVLDAEDDRLSLIQTDIASLPTYQHLERFLTSHLKVPNAPTVVLVLVSLRFRVTVSRQNQEAGLALAARGIREALRATDMLFRCGPTDFIVVLPQTEASAANSVVERIAQNLSVASTADNATTWAATLGIAVAPSDGTSVEALLSTARYREQPALSTAQRRSIH